MSETTATSRWRTRPRRWLLAVTAVVALLLLVREYVRPYRIHGPSDAPTYLWGDVVLANRAAYDLRLPFTSISLVRTGAPGRGDMVLFRPPDSDYLVVRRIVGLPGDTVEVRASRVVLNGELLTYEPFPTGELSGVDPRNKIGTIVEWEAGAGPRHPITYTPGDCGVATMAPAVVPRERYFLMGDNRDHCNDSRRIGPVERGRIRAKIVRTLRSSSAARP